MPGRTTLFKACRKCKLLVPPRTKVCPNCGSTDFSDDWSGVAIIFTEDSTIAKKLNITKPGRYALIVR